MGSLERNLGQTCQQKRSSKQEFHDESSHTVIFFSLFHFTFLRTFRFWSSCCFLLFLLPDVSPPWNRVRRSSKATRPSPSRSRLENSWSKTCQEQMKSQHFGNFGKKKKTPLKIHLWLTPLLCADYRALPSLAKNKIAILSGSCKWSYRVVGQKMEEKIKQGGTGIMNHDNEGGNWKKLGPSRKWLNTTYERTHTRTYLRVEQSADKVNSNNLGC